MVSSPEAEVSIASPAPSTPVRPSVEHSPPNKGCREMGRPLWCSSTACAATVAFGTGK